MRSNTFQPIAANERLRLRLDDFYSCMEDCLNCLRVQDAFCEVCDALSKEMDELLTELSSLEEQYQEELPLEADEPKQVVWVTEGERMMEYRKKLQEHAFGMGSDFVGSLVERLGQASETMTRIEDLLYTEEDADIYASYCKRELEDYAMSRWNRPFREIRNKLAMAPANHQDAFIDDLLEEVLSKIRGVSDFITNQQTDVIFYEALGRHLWQLRHTANSVMAMDEVLCLVKTAEYYCGRRQRKFIYLDRETCPEEEQDGQVRLERVKQETLQHQLEMVVFRLDMCKEFFAKGFTTEFVKKMLEDLIESEHCARVCEKMSQRKIRKFIHQIAGLLKDQRIFEECSYRELAIELKFEKPRCDSRIDYIRHMVDDEPEIQQWMVDYIARYREEMKSRNGA